MKKGDFVDTPRFLKVRIEKVFRNRQNAAKAGYTEPTHYKDSYGFSIFGKATGRNTMIFAAVRPDRI